MPNKTKQNTKNSTEQICSQPLYKSQTTHHTHPHPKTIASGWLCGQPPQQVADAHTVLNVNPTVCLLATTFHTQPKHAPTPTTHIRWHTHAGTRKQHNTTPTGHAACSPQNGLPRKEVIQPHLPVRLPCYDFVPITSPTFDRSP